LISNLNFSKMSTLRSRVVVAGEPTVGKT